MIKSTNNEHNGKEYADHNSLIYWIERKKSDSYSREKLGLLRQHSIRKLNSMSKKKESKLLLQDIQTLRNFIKYLEDVPYYSNKFDNEVLQAREYLEDNSSLVTDTMPRKYDPRNGLFSVVDIEVNQDILQGQIIFLNSISKRLVNAGLDKDLTDDIEKRIPILETHIIKWNNIKTYDNYSDKTDMQLIQRNVAIHKQNVRFKKFLYYAFNNGINGEPCSSFIELLGKINQMDKSTLDDCMFYETSLYDGEENRVQTENGFKIMITRINTYELKDLWVTITNMLQSMVIVEKHAKQGGDKNQLARAIFNLYNTHIMEHDELTEIISNYIGQHVFFDIRKLSTHELFRNPPEWLKKILGQDGTIMPDEIIRKKESSIKKEIEKEKQNIKKIFLKLTYGKKRNINDPIQSQYFEKSFNDYINGGGFTRLDQNIDLKHLDELLNKVRSL